MKVNVKSDLKFVLIVGSAPDALRVSGWNTSIFAHRVVINNAWRVCDTWNCLIYPEDFPPDRHPPLDQTRGKQLITAKEFVSIQNQYGGFVYAGGTMAFTAGYWALGALQPDVIAYIGCDMIYEPRAGQATHFYGQGRADPLRQDVTLQSLEAKSVRLWALAQRQGCSVVNLSDQATSRLLFPRVSWPELEAMAAGLDPGVTNGIELDQLSVDQALLAEAELGYRVPSGRYWEIASGFNKTKLRDIDNLWLAASQAKVLVRS
ncbi:MAG: hypothetical protein QE285_20910 [Aquabacterium sp.]|nr:hypothetical protein [Aquabacterium sp.]